MTLKPPLLLIAWLLLFGWGNALGQAKTITDPSSLVSLGSTARYSDLPQLVCRRVVLRLINRLMSPYYLSVTPTARASQRGKRT
jgi:hypothetical protein